MKVGTCCRSCGAIIIWAVSSAGNRMPVDFRRVPGGNIELEERGAYPVPPMAHFVKPDPQVERFVSHFATCPDRREWRRR